MDSEYDIFISYLQHEKRYSPHTILAYDTDLKQYLTFLQQQYQITNPSEASHFIIRSWVVSLMENKLDPRSVNRKITTLRTLYRFLVREGKSTAKAYDAPLVIIKHTAHDMMLEKTWQETADHIVAWLEKLS